MMTSSNGNIFCITGPLFREFTGEFPSQRPVMWSFDVFFDIHLNKQLSKHFQTLVIWDAIVLIMMSLYCMQGSHLQAQSRFWDLLNTLPAPE